jgi:hypothetical protein
MKITVAIPPRPGRGEARGVGEGRADTNASYGPEPSLSQQPEVRHQAPRPFAQRAAFDPNPASTMWRPAPATWITPDRGSSRC